MTVAYLDLADFLAIGELALDIPAKDLAPASRLDLAESALHAPAAGFGDVEFYPVAACWTGELQPDIANTLADLAPRGERGIAEIEVRHRRRVFAAEQL